MGATPTSAYGVVASCPRATIDGGTSNVSAAPISEMATSSRRTTTNERMSLMGFWHDGRNQGTEQENRLEVVGSNRVRVYQVCRRHTEVTD